MGQQQMSELKDQRCTEKQSREEQVLEGPQDLCPTNLSPKVQHYRISRYYKEASWGRWLYGQHQHIKLDFQ